MNEKNGKRKFGLRDKVGYALGDVGSNLTLTMMQSYMLVFYTKVLGVPGAVIGTVLLLAKFVDAFTDMAMGRIIDTHTDKRGERFRPWIRRFAIPVVVSSVLLYNIFIEGWPMWAKIAYMTIVYLIYGSICYTGVTIPYGAMVSAMTSDPEEKAGLSAFRNVGAFLAAMVTGAIIPQFVYTKDSAGNEIANGSRFLMIAVIFGIFALLSFFLCYRWSVERICIPNKEKEDDKSNLWSSMKQVFSDRALLSIIIISICMSSALGVIQSMNQYLFLDYFKNTSLLSVASLAMMACMLLPAPVAPKLSGKIGKKEVSIGGLAWP